MTKQVLKSSTEKDEFICLTCKIEPDCMSGSPQCPINARNASTEPEVYQAIMEAFEERDRLIQMKKDLEKEIRRVRQMEAETRNIHYKKKAQIEIDRLKIILDETVEKRKRLKEKNLAEHYEVPLQFIRKMAKRRYW